MRPRQRVGSAQARRTRAESLAVARSVAVGKSVSAAKSIATAGAVGLAVVGLAGCSQIASLKQVSGVPLTTLTIATNDVLVQQQVPILKAPVCSLANKVYTCAGSTVTNQAITVTAPDTENLVMEIKVGDKVIFTGPVQDVIEKAQQGGAP